MKKIREVIRLRLDRKASLSEIAAACGIGRTTASEYSAKIEASGLSWPLAEELSDGELKDRLSPEKPLASARPLPDFSEIRRELARKGVTLKLLWQEYRDRTPGKTYSYSRFARHYAEWLKKSDLRMLQHHKAGQKMFVDWAGLTMPITDPKTGEVSEAPVFVTALGCSQLIFAEVLEATDLRQWLKGHSDALEFYGALPEILVPDNPKTGVTKPCRYEPVLNPTYAEFAQFYGIAVIPARRCKWSAPFPEDNLISLLFSVV